MKVFIGPYRNWIGPYQIANAVFFWVKYNNKEYDNLVLNRWDYKACDKFGDWLSNTWVNKFCEWVHSKINRKINIHIDRYDTWNMDHTLAMIIIPMLKQLKATKHSSPYVDDKDVPIHLRSTNAPPKKNEWDTDNFHHDRWNWVIDEMIWAFEQIINDENELSFFSEETKKFDRASFKKYNKRIENGLTLFGKYYRGLWD